MENGHPKGDSTDRIIGLQYDDESTWSLEIAYAEAYWAQMRREDEARIRAGGFGRGDDQGEGEDEDDEEEDRDPDPNDPDLDEEDKLDQEGGWF